MKSTYLTLFLFLLFPCLTEAQNYTISGYAMDGESSETLIGASVYDSNSKKGVVSNSFGFYSLTLPRGAVAINCSYVGYKPKIIKFDLSKDTVINVLLNKTMYCKKLSLPLRLRKPECEGRR